MLPTYLQVIPLANKVLKMQVYMLCLGLYFLYRALASLKEQRMNRNFFSPSKINNYFALLIILLLGTGCASVKSKDNYSIFKDADKQQEYIAAYNTTLTLWPVPYKEMDIPTTYGTAHVIVSGPENGEPLVLFHGLDASSTMWYPNVASYTKKYRVYAVDYILGSGKSVLKGDRPDMKEMNQWYNEVFNALKLKEFNLAGISIGGWLATSYTLNNQDRVKKLVLMSPVQTFGNMKFNWKTRRTVNFKFFPTRKRLNKALEVLSHHPENIGEEYRNQMYLGTLYTKMSFDMVKMKPFEKKLLNLKIPVLVLAGEYDALCGPKLIKEVKKQLPQAQTALIPDAGHFITNDQQQLTDAKLMEFLSGKVNRETDMHDKVTLNSN